MARPLSAYDTDAKLLELRDQGFCAFEEAVDAEGIRRVSRCLREFVDGVDPARLAGFGATIFALASREPRMREFYGHVPVMEFLERALQSPLVWKRTGARISGRAGDERIVWHHHHGWDPRLLATRTRFERLLFLCYLEGCDRAHGPLIVKPRAFSDPFEDAPLARFDPLPDEVHLELPPGSILVMDAPVLHSARRGTCDDLRMVWGAHAQSRDLEREHPEDDPTFERARVGVRHRLYRWGLRNGRRWIEQANRRPLASPRSYGSESADTHVLSDDPRMR